MSPSLSLPLPLQTARTTLLEPAGAPQVLFAEIDHDKLNHIREQLPSLSHRRADLFS